ncbi:MAG TPA: site-2 protease family protein [Longimicrobiaceae bacterium]|nr:site-2 protease family protein [Longimicrobiaceae bacterium]
MAVPEDLFARYRHVLVRDVEVLRGTLLPYLSVHDPQVAAALSEWSGTRYAQPAEAGAEVMLVRRAQPRPAERWWLHTLLLALTFLSTTVCGAFLAGWNPPLSDLVLFGMRLDLPAAVRAADLLPGLWFSLPLCGTLLGHELGHYLTARWHQLDVSPPYFIPAPYLVSLLGTFGAFIRLRTPLLNRVALLDVGAGGPLAGMLLAVPITVAGLLMSHPLAGTVPPDGMRYVVFWAGQPALPVNGSLLFDALARVLVAPHGMVALHPMAVAGWFGCFFTMLNLLPAGQLDGGHVLYALFGRAQQVVGAVAVAALLWLGQGWGGWWFWAVAILVLGRGRVSHPAVLDDAFRPRGWRTVAGWACIVIAVLTFNPRPL